LNNKDSQKTGVIHMAVSEREALTLPDGRMDTTTAAAYLGVTRATLNFWRWEGSGPRFIKPGRVYYYKKDLDEWLMRGGLVTSSAAAQRQHQPHPRKKAAAT
jgi:hypothetical protein